MNFTRSYYQVEQEFLLFSSLSLGENRQTLLKDVLVCLLVITLMKVNVMFSLNQDGFKVTCRLVLYAYVPLLSEICHVIYPQTLDSVLWFPLLSLHPSL